MLGIELTLFNAHNPTRLSKRFELDRNGELVKEPGGALYAGEARKLKLSGLDEFAQLLTGLTPANALSYGINGHDHALVVSKAKLATTVDDSLPIISRDREHMGWSAGPGILLGDYDPADGEESLLPEALLDLLYTTCPALHDAPHLLRPSASSCIFNMDMAEKIRGVRGMHIYMVVKDASDIARAGQVLFDRLWLAGHGRIAISKSGAMLLRGPVDASVYQPERLDFCGGAECVAPLQQKLPEPLIFNPDAQPLDTRSALPDLTKAERAKLLQLQTDAKAACAAEAAAVKAQWLEGRVKEYVERYPDTPEPRLREVLKQAVEGTTLGPEFILYTSDWQAVTVAELLADPERWDGEYLRDPLEPDYGSTTVWLNLKGNSPHVFSHAHGLNARYGLTLARATIQLVSGDRPKTVAAAIAALREEGLLFEHGGEVVRLVEGGVQPVAVEWLLIHLGKLIHFTRWDVRNQAIVTTDCPQDLPKQVLGQRGEWGLPVLRTVISAPIMRLDGSVLQDRGYDEATGLYLTQQPEVRINTRPSKAEVVAALRRIWYPFKEFPFATPTDQGVMLAAIFTAVMRPILPTAPAFGFDAPAAGSGKTLLTECLGLLAGVSAPAMMPPVAQEEELRKRLLSSLRTGKAVIVLDNQVERLDSAALCTFLTSSVYSDRMLGQSLTLAFPNTALFLLSGNNIRLVGDLARRVLTSRLDARMERPDRRSFDLDPKAWVEQHRQEMVRDVITVLLGYRVEGRRRGKSRMASFETWDDVVRQAVLWAAELGVVELGDPFDAIDTAFAQDPEHAKLAALLHGLHELFDEKPKKVAEIIKAAHDQRFACFRGVPDEDRGLAAVLEEVAGEGHGINPRRLGRWLERHQGQIIDGLRLERGPSRNGMATWTVRRVK
ncbi:hypothetical protein [Pseudomonas sp. R5(2019)]|uniref:hypothetical protein n=1 Tax=Pseudomonas sp. R5(2019) TaxID=2697566 RepID=UPI001413252B|nr:hypothetical protein [Pseudomonas sp. R5(2019)]NBA96298.1 hypothetical protein [Pseudomonas sp. R5(2019)]